MNTSDKFVWKPLGEVCEKPEYGYTTSATFNGKGPHFLRTTDISKGEINWKTVPFCAVLPNDEEKYKLKDGDLLISRAGSVGASVVIKKPPRAVFASYIIRFRPKDELDSSYAGFFLRSNIFFRQLGGKTSGTTLPGINATNLSNVKIPVPPLPTQRKIASILDRCESARAKRKEANRLTDEFLKSVFLDMFGDPVRNSKGWDAEKIKNVCSAESGGTPSTTQKEYWENGDIPWLGSTCCKDDFVRETTAYITKEGLENSSAKVFKKKTVLVALVGATIGKTGFLTFDSTTNQNIVGLYPLKRSRIVPEYLFFTVQFLYPRFLALSRSGFKMANLTFVRNLDIPLPPLNLQQKFAGIVQKTEKLKEKQRESEKELNNLFNSLMQKAFRGELS